MDALPIEYNDCWLWRGSIGSTGYGVVTRRVAHRQYVTQVAHRHVYRLLVDDIGKELELDHLCKNKICVKPVHLEPVTRQENMRRRYAHNTCKQGHKLEGKNLKTYNYRGMLQRRCRTCDNIAQNKRQRAYRANK